MALREMFMLKRVTSGNLTLTAVEESFEIKDIVVAGAANPTDYFKIMLKNTTMSFIPAYLLGAKPFGGMFKNLFDYVREKIPDFPNYKVVNGETLTIEPEGSYNALEARYAVYDPGDIALGDPGTRTAEVRPFIVSAYNSSDISSTGWHEPDAVVGLPEAPKHPFLARIPAGKQLLIAGIAMYVSKAGSTKPVYLRIWDGEKVLFDEDKNGFLVDPDIMNDLAPAVNLSYTTTSGSAVTFFRFPEPLVMPPQAEYTWEVYVDYDGTNALPAKGIMITLVGLEVPAR